MSEQRFTIAQCLVGGYVGFGILTGVLCFMMGGWGFWFLMTSFLTLTYSAYYLLNAARKDKVRASSSNSDPEQD